MPDEHPHTVESPLERTRAAAHSGCYFCGREHPTGLKLEFHELENGSVTAELVVRFLTPVRLDRPGEVTAAVTRVRGPLFYMRAEFRQGRSLAVRATFMAKDRAARVRRPGRSASAPILKGSQRLHT